MYDDTDYILCSYAFDVDPQTESFGNKRVFSYIDGGVPHGLQLDTAGNLYAGTGDGVEVGDVYCR